MTMHWLGWVLRLDKHTVYVSSFSLDCPMWSNVQLCLTGSHDTLCHGTGMLREGETDGRQLQIVAQRQGDADENW